MKIQEAELPSNKKFGGFFTAVFLLAAGYCGMVGFHIGMVVLTLFATSFLLATIVRADVLLPLNRLWMRLGLLIGKVVGPLVLGVIFFLIFTPLAVLMRISGRDELRLSFRNKTSHWLNREESPGPFSNQF